MTTKETPMTPAATPKDSIGKERANELRAWLIENLSPPDGRVNEEWRDNERAILAILDQYALQTNQNNDHVGQKNGQDKEDK